VPSPIPADVPTNSTATVKHLQEAIEEWANENTRDLVLCLIGEGRNGSFSINQTETLSAVDLSAWLDVFQASHPEGRDVIVIYDACQSGSFLPSLPAPEGNRRVVIASAKEEQTAWFMLGGAVSFSQFFWRQVLAGANVWDAFTEAYDAIRQASGLKQEPQLDGNGDAHGNNPSDRQVARLLKIGMGLQSAGPPR
jgi:hypothetical protein